MSGTRKVRSLSDRALRVLRVIAADGPLPSALCPELVAAAGGSGRGLYETLLHLQGRFLVRWDGGGSNIRATKRAHDLLASSHYRGRVDPRPSNTGVTPPPPTTTRTNS